MQTERYLRQISLFGQAGQKKIEAASVVIIGAGGLGCSALQYLAAGGVGRIGIIDCDRIELSNLPRQVLYHESDIGKYKCHVAKEKAAALNPHITVEDHAIKLDPENAKSLIKNYDLVIDATDNFAARYAINDACVELQKPFVYGSIDQFEGQVALFHPPHGPDYRELFPLPAECSSCSEGGVIGALPGIIGSIQALEAIKWIAGMEETLASKLLIINTLTWKTRLFRMGPDTPYILISPEKLRQNRGDYFLIDIREAPKKGYIFEGDMWIPFSQILERFMEIPKDKAVVLFCQSGKRSLIAAKELRKRSLKAYSLEMIHYQELMHVTTRFSNE